MTAASTLVVTASILVATISVAACAGFATGSDAPSDAAASDAAPPSSMVVTRTGGFAGVNDVVEIAADGTATVASKTGVTSSCTPSPAAVERLRAIDLAAVGTGLPKTPIADGFVYSVTSAGEAATAADGDNSGPRAAFVLAAAEVVTSCLENQSAETE
jgi:hypothetical protein